ncbi:MAG: fumarylacetoacetate hydrolase family protein [Actinomycetota bacterium]
MRLYRFVSTQGGYQPRTALGIDDGPPIDLLAAWGAAHGKSFDLEEEQFLVSTLQLIEEGREVWNEVEHVARGAAARDDLRVTGADVRWACPLDRLSSLRDFLAFEDHVERGAQRRGQEVPQYWYEAPVYYKGNHRSIIGPDEECHWPPYTEHLDLELELAMIVGKRGRNVTREEAGDFVFGFSILNDFSARDIQAREASVWLGPAKGKDFASALGPCIVTADEIGSEPDLEMICYVNGEEWGRGRSSDARWRWADMIAHVSMGEDVFPGDVYGSGTPGGCCGVDIGRRLEPGDTVELEIERIGRLRNPIGPR